VPKSWKRWGSVRLGTTIVTVFAAAPILAESGDKKASKTPQENAADQTTMEIRMLAESEKETRQKRRGKKEGPLLFRMVRAIRYYIREYLVESIATGFRFLTLAVVFVPVILSIPAVWVGSRQKDRDNERSGTLWWYGFLIRSMERAGPTFIKVRILSIRGDQTTMLTFRIARTMGSFTH
jgi:aarF domain-containing kinase